MPDINKNTPFLTGANSKQLSFFFIDEEEKRNSTQKLNLYHRYMKELKTQRR